MFTTEDTEKKRAHRDFLMFKTTPQHKIIFTQRHKDHKEKPILDVQNS